MDAAVRDSLVDFPTTEHPESLIKRERAARICAGAVDLKRALYRPLAAQRFESGEMLDAVHFAGRGTFGGRSPSEAADLRCGRVMRLISSGTSCRPCVIKGVADRKASVGRVREVCRAPLTAAEWRPKMFGPPSQIFRLPFPAGETIAHRHSLTNEGRGARHRMTLATLCALRDQHREDST